VDGLELAFGNGEALLHFIEQISHRRGFGDLLAEGTKIMGERLKAGYYAIHVKGLEVDATDPPGVWMPARFAIFENQIGKELNDALPSPLHPSHPRKPFHKKPPGHVPDDHELRYRRGVR
jgi:aldehyde:ferredoxin oxidoreductase